MKNLFLIILSCFMSTVACGQPVALKKFLDSDFMTVFDSLRTNSKDMVLDFKAEQHEYLEEDVLLLRDKYDSLAGKFNNILLKVRDDLGDKKKRNQMRKKPDSYTEELERNLTSAKNEYEDFLDAYQGITENYEYGAGAIVVIMQIIKYGGTAVNLFNELFGEWKTLNQKIIDKHLIEKHRFLLWDEL